MEGEGRRRKVGEKEGRREGKEKREGGAKKRYSSTVFCRKLVVDVTLNNSCFPASQVPHH